MQAYEQRVYLEVKQWIAELLKPPGLVASVSKNIQTKLNDLVPPKAQDVITVAIKGLFNSVLFGLKFIPTSGPQQGLSLEERDRLAETLMEQYKRIAAVEGAGTGGAGFLLAMADFPALIAIKMKFLFEIAHIYGYSTKEFTERLFLLLVFQLAFSGQQVKTEILRKIINWEQHKIAEREFREINWEQLQREYRDALDLRKLLQMVPGIGAAVGAWANYSLLKDLGQTAMNCYRLRILQANYDLQF